MRTRFIFAILMVLALGNAAIGGTFESGSTGADGVFNPAASIELQVPPNGIFNFTAVNIPSGVVVTFKKNAFNTPVYVLVSGDALIAGTIKVNGGMANTITPGDSGPGGFSGGFGGSNYSLPGGRGLGPGGGSGGAMDGYGSGGGGGGFGIAGSSGNVNTSAGGTYSNAKIVPLIGGSGGGGGGGGGYYGGSGSGGGGGAGAMLLAARP